jgi:hypothetical protein
MIFRTALAASVIGLLPLAAGAEPMQLRFASPAPSMSPITVGGIQPWAKAVN